MSSSNTAPNTTWVIDQNEPSEPSEVELTVQERGKDYGHFKEGARIMQELKNTIYTGESWEQLSEAQAEALHMICHKMGRIVNGNLNHRDSWLDIAGYATLIVQLLDGENP